MSRVRRVEREGSGSVEVAVRRATRSYFWWFREVMRKVEE